MSGQDLDARNSHDVERVTVLLIVIGCHVTLIDEKIELNKSTPEHGVLQKLMLLSSRYLSISSGNGVLVWNSNTSISTCSGFVRIKCNLASEHLSIHLPEIVDMSCTGQVDAEAGSSVWAGGDFRVIVFLSLDLSTMSFLSILGISGQTIAT